MGDTYDLLPHEEVLFLKSEVKRLQDQHDLAYPDHEVRGRKAEADGKKRLPHGRLLHEREEVEMAARADFRYTELMASMGRLSAAVETLLRILQEAAKDLKPDLKGEEKPAAKLFTDPKLSDKLNEISGQNEKIAEGIVSLAHIVQDAFAGLEPYRNIAERLDRLELLIQLQAKDRPFSSQAPTPPIPQQPLPQMTSFDVPPPMMAPIPFPGQDLTAQPEGPAVEPSLVPKEVGLFESYKLLPHEEEPLPPPLPHGTNAAPVPPLPPTRGGLMPPPLPPSRRGRQ